MHYEEYKKSGALKWILAMHLGYSGEDEQFYSISLSKFLIRNSEKIQSDSPHLAGF